jgi:hypothetical protein
VLNAPATVTAPFMLDLLLSVHPNSSPIAFSGTGTARISLDEHKGFGVPSWLLTHIRADLSGSPAPVPEPATLLLLGGGLAGVTLTRLRRKRR